MDQHQSPLAALLARIAVADRPELLWLLAASINMMTVVGRWTYDSPDAADRLREVNEAIHRLAGHLRDLCRPNEILTASRQAGIEEQLRLLPPSLAALIGNSGFDR